MTGDDQVMALGDDNYAWAKVDRIPRGREGGRLRFFRDRRSNLPGMADRGNIAELPIPDAAGLIEPTHVVLAGDGLIAAEYNHFAPRITSQFAQLLRTKLGMNLSIGTYVHGSIIEQLDRLEYIQLLELSLVPTPGLEDELRNEGRNTRCLACPRRRPPLGTAQRQDRPRRVLDLRLVERSGDGVTRRACGPSRPGSGR